MHSTTLPPLQEPDLVELLAISVLHQKVVATEIATEISLRSHSSLPGFAFPSDRLKRGFHFCRGLGLHSWGDVGIQVHRRCDR